MSACSQLDAKWEKQNIFPVVTTYTNVSNQTLAIEALGSGADESNQYFLVTDKKLAPGESFDINTRVEVSEVVIAKEFLIRGQCQNDEQIWDKNAADIAEIKKIDKTHIVVELNACD